MRPVLGLLARLGTGVARSRAAKVSGRQSAVTESHLSSLSDLKRALLNSRTAAATSGPKVTSPAMNTRRFLLPQHGVHIKPPCRQRDAFEVADPSDRRAKSKAQKPRRSETGQVSAVSRCQPVI